MNDLIFAIVATGVIFALFVGGFILYELPDILETEIVKEWARNRGVSAKAQEIEGQFNKHRYLIDGNRENILYLDKRCNELEKRVRELETELSRKGLPHENN